AWAVLHLTEEGSCYARSYQPSADLATRVRAARTCADAGPAAELLIRALCGQLQFEHRSGRGRAKIQASMMRLGDRARDGQPEAEALTGPRRVTADEALEQVGDPWPRPLFAWRRTRPPPAGDRGS